MKFNLFRIRLISLVVVVFILSLSSFYALAQSKEVVSVTKVPVLTLGTFHFNFPNLDQVKVADENIIDVLEPKYQQEIEMLVDRLYEFKPTIIVIERGYRSQPKVDSLYRLYREGGFVLGRSEDQQIGFRLAKKLNLEKLYCVDDWGGLYDKTLKLMQDDSSEQYKSFERSFSETSDSLYRYEPEMIFKSNGIIAEIVELNKRENIVSSLGNYLIGHFKFECEPYDYTGVDFETGRWFNRNLRIFRNIQRIEAGADDRILVIYGSGHLNVLNYLFEASPEYRLENTSQYLEVF